VVSSTPRPHFTHGKDPVPILQEAGWAPGPVWTGGKTHPHRDSIPDRLARSSVAIPTELPGPPLKCVRAIFKEQYNKWCTVQSSIQKQNASLFQVCFPVFPFSVYNCCFTDGTYRSRMSFVLPHLHLYVALAPQPWLPFFQALAFLLQVTWNQWRTQEFCSVKGGGGGEKQIQWGKGDRENPDLGGEAPH